MAGAEETVLLEFGDVLVTGQNYPTSGDLLWDAQLNVVGRNAGEQNERTLEAFRIGPSDTGEASLWLGGTVELQHIQILGRLTLLDARSLFARACDPRYFSIMEATLLSDGADKQPARPYRAILHNTNREDQGVDIMTLVKRYSDRLPRDLLG